MKEHPVAYLDLSREMERVFVRMGWCLSGCLGFNLMAKFWHLAGTFWRRRQQGTTLG